ncbi:hypothetical protein JL722_3892 [Aureococcus anophagefferens]|nr:hypothetical protein JL722_3892 [Aureococcus anophagefferens]
MNAAGALWELSGNVENKIAINRAGGIPPLVALLGNGRDIARIRAAGALWNLAVNDENKVVIHQAGGIPPLVTLLSVSGSGSEKAAGALANLARNSTAAVAIVEAGGISALVAVMSPDNSRVTREKALGALLNLLVHKPADRADRIAMLEAGAIPSFVALLRDGNDDVQHDAAGALATAKWIASKALANLTENNVDNKAAVAAARAAAEIAAYKAKTLALEQRIVDLERSLEERTARDDRLRLSRDELQARIGEFSRVLNRPNVHGVLARAEAGAVLSDLRDEAAELKATLEDATSCVVCFGAPRSVVLLPCTHACLCPACAAKLEACPACSAPIASRSDFILW